MKNLITVGLLLCSGWLFAQENTSKPADEKSDKALSAQQVLTVHAARAYQLAIRYNDYAGARSALYDILAENPNSDSVLYSLSYLFLESGQYASAAISAQDLEKLNPDHLGGIEIRAIAFEKLGLMEKSMNNYEDLYFKTSDYQSLYKVAFLQYELKRYKESNSNVQILLEKKEASDLKVTFTTESNEQKEYPIKVALLNLQGLNAEGVGNTEEARTYYKQALEMAPDFILAKENLDKLNK